MIKKYFKFLAFVILAVAIIIPTWIFTPETKEVNAQKNSLMDSEVIFDNSKNYPEVNLANYKTEFEIGKEVFKENGIAMVSAEDFQRKTNTDIKYQNGKVTLESETNSVKIENENKEIKVDNVESDVLPKQTRVYSDECVFAFEQVAEALGYNVNQTANKYVLTRDYFVKRLVVKSETQPDAENAIAMARRYDEYIICYATETDTKNAFEKFQKSDLIESVAVDGVVTLDEIEESHSTPQETYSFVSWGATVMGVDKYRDEISKYGTLNEVVVAVIDTGLYDSHEWFQGRVVEGGGSLLTGLGTFTPEVYQDEMGGHGTHVSGIICDLTPNNVKILPIKALGADGGYTSDIAAAIRYISDLNDSRIKAINLSLGGEHEVGSIGYEWYKNAIVYAKNKGILSVAASGNESDDVAKHGPANVEEAITVGSVANNYGSFERASSSNYGIYVDVCAPGVSINSAAVGGGTTYKSGTSMATPHVSAAIALMYSNPNKSYTTDSIERELKLTAHDLGADGRDDEYGAGMVNVQHIYTDIYDDKLSITIGNQVFEDSFTVTMSTNLSGAKIYYTTDDTYPSINNNVYESPVVITSTVKIRAVAYVVDSDGDITAASEIETELYTKKDDIQHYFKIDLNGVIVGCDRESVKNLTEIEVPGYVNGRKVVKIGDWALSELTNLESVILPDTVNTIANYAFTCCYNLKSVIANGVVTIGREAFYNCSEIETLSLANVEEIGDYAFTASSGENRVLATLNTPKLKIVGIQTFCNCTSLSTLISNLESVGSYAFYACPITNLELPNLKEVKEYAFANNTTVESFYAPNVNTILEGAFTYCYNLKTVIADGVRVIGRGAFYNCLELETLSISNVEAIGDFAFANNMEIESVYAPNVLTIYENAFRNCTKLRNVVIDAVEVLGVDGKDTDTLDGGVFVGCSSLKEIYLPKVELIYGICFDSTLEKAFLAKSLLYFSNMIVPNETMVYCYDYAYVTSNVVKYQLIDEVFTVDIDGANANKVGISADETVTIKATTNGFRNEYKWYKIESNGSSETEVLYCEGVDKIQITLANKNERFKLVAKNWDGQTASQIVTVVEVRHIISEILEGSGKVDVSDEMIQVGGSVYVDITPDEGYKISEIMVNGVDYGQTDFFYIENINENVTISVKFEILKYETIVESIGNGSTTLNKTIVNYGDNVELIVEPDAGYQVSKIIVNGVVMSTLNYEITNIKQNTKIQVVFAIKKYNITLSSNDYGKVIANSTKVEHGSSVEIKFIENPNCYLNAVKINGEQVSLNSVDNNKLIITNVTADVEVEADFKPQTYTISIQAENGSVEPMISGSTVEHGQLLTIKFIPNEGYAIESVIINDVYQTQNITENELVISVSGNINITAIFAVKKLKIQIIQANGGIIQATGSGSHVVYGNDSEKYMFTACEGYSLKSIIIDGVIVDSSVQDIIENGYQFVNVTENHTISAKFEPKTYNVTTQVSGSGSVEINRNTVEHGGRVDVQITAAVDSEILAIYINNHKQPSIKTNFSINNITEDVVIKVLFEVKMYIVNVIQSDGGVITPNGVFEVEHGGSVLFEIMPDTGYKIKEIRVNGVAVSASSEYLLENITSRNDISVIFERIEFTLTVISGENGTVSPYGIMQVKHGDNKLLKVTPDAGYAISKITINNLVVENNSDIVLSNIVENTIVNVEFKRVYSITTSHSNGGMITESENVSGGETKEIVIMANEGFKVKDVIIDGVSVGAVETYSFANIQQAHSIEVVFEQISYVISVTVKGQANIVSELPLSAVGYGESRIIHVQPKNENWKINKIFINGNETEVLNGIIMLNNIKNDVEIQVEMIEEKEENNTWIIIVIIGTSVIIAGGVVLTIVLIKRHKKKKTMTDFNKDKVENNSERTQETIVEKPKSISENQLRNESNKSSEQAVGLPKQTNEIQSQKAGYIYQKPNAIQPQNQQQNNTQQRIVNPQTRIPSGVQARPVNPQLRPMNSSSQINSQVRPINPQVRPVNPQVRTQQNVQANQPTVRPAQSAVRPAQPQGQPRPMQPRMGMNESKIVRPQPVTPSVVKPQVQKPNNGGVLNGNNSKDGK